MARVASDLSLQDVLTLIRQLRFPTPLSNVKNGWLTLGEAQMLYGLAYFLDGPFLEIGAWAGLSTTIIAKGIIDSGHEKRFVTAELNPGMANFQPQPGGMGFFNPPESDVCLGVVGMESFNAEIRPVLERPGGIIGLLQENLAAADMADRVQIHLGDFNSSPMLNYNFIFTDAAHNIPEIDTCLPRIMKIFGNRRAILALHDTSEEHRLHICDKVHVVQGVQIDSLFVCEIDGSKSQTGSLKVDKAWTRNGDSLGDLRLAKVA